MADTRPKKKTAIALEYDPNDLPREHRMETWRRHKQ